MMEKFRNKKIYKACEPSVTIEKVRRIIKECGIELTETNFHNETSMTDVSELRFAYEELGKTRIATNGKGMTPLYSLASASGEMMERLECDGLLVNYQIKAYKNGDIRYLVAPDEEMVDGEKFLDNSDIFLALTGLDKEILRPAFKDKKLLAIPFYDVINKKQVLVPWWEVFVLVSSNGMCAGNTPKEAMAQGLNEIYERAALCEIYRDNPELHKLDKRLFEGSAVLEKLNHLETLGYKSDIIDASMGKDYPVIGLRITSEKGLNFNLGADPSPIVALERCLTEQYQSTGERGIELRTSKDSCGTRSKCRNFIEESFYHLQLERSKHVGSGEKPDNVHEIPDIYSDHYIYNSEDINDFDYLLDLTKKLGYSLYIRDCSFLGFPAYMTFIPQISAGDYFDSSLVSQLNSLFGNPSYKEIEGYEIILPILKNLEEKKIEANIHQDESMFQE